MSYVFTKEVLGDISFLCKKGLGVPCDGGSFSDYVSEFLAEKLLDSYFNDVGFCLGVTDWGHIRHVNLVLRFNSRPSAVIEADYHYINHPEVVHVVSKTVEEVNRAIKEYLVTGELPVKHHPVQLPLFEDVGR